MGIYDPFRELERMRRDIERVVAETGGGASSRPFRVAFLPGRGARQYPLVNIYQDGDDFYFMDTTSFEQVHISSEALGDSVSYLKPEMTIQVEFYGSEPVGIELPPTVDLLVEDTAPGIKGATASNQIKPATLETGVVVNVPPFINTGDVIRVNTETGEYLSRA